MTFALAHFVGALTTLIGFILLLMWAQKHFSAAMLKKWGVVLVLSGIVFCLALSLLAQTHGMDKGMMKMKMKMKGGMTMDHMVMSLEGKTGDAFDRAFIDGMIEHHQGAIDMAELAQTSAGHQEIKDMADAIISTQQKEIDDMKSWKESWGL